MLICSDLIVMFCYQGSMLYHYFKDGKLERSEGSSITEGQKQILAYHYSAVEAVGTSVHLLAYIEVGL